MTEFCFQSTNSTTKNNKNTKNKNKKFSICSFIFSHPLYFSYLIFFSPYLLKLLSFLSPLFFTTSLLFLSLLTTLIPLRSIINSKEGFFLTAYNTLLENSHPISEDEEGKLQQVEEFEVYKAVFEIPTIEVIAENPVDNETIQENPVEIEKIQENPLDSFVEKVIIHQVGSTSKGTGDECENLTMEQKKVDTKPKKKESNVTRIESKANEVYNKTPKSGNLKLNNGEKFGEAFSQTLGGQPNMGSFGSMRKEKEWRRTLACKLFEERHNGSNNNVNVNGGKSEEGMDLLWETHETESYKVKPKEEESKKGKGKRREKIEDLMVVNDDEEYFDDHGKFCCLQALKLSAGKMNLNMGSRISKAFKGIGLLQNHVKKQGKKGYK